MPNYDWKCRECGFAFELNRPSDVKTILCPRCETYEANSVADRLPSAPAFAVRGGTPKFHDKGR